MLSRRTDYKLRLQHSRKYTDMPPSEPHTDEPQEAPYNAFGNLLRFWRNAARFTQAELAGQLGTAARHISFLETGRSQPTREMIERLAEVFQFSNRERDMLHVAAGFMPDSEEIDIDAPKNRYLKENACLLLAKHDPYPAVVVSNVGDLLLCNKSWLQLMQDVMPDKILSTQSNMFDLFFSAQGLKDIIHEWETFSCMVLMKIQEQQLLTGNQKLKELCEWLQAYPGIPKNWIERAQTMEQGSHYRMNIKLPIKDGQAVSFHTRAVISGIDPERLSPLSQIYMHAFFPLSQSGVDYCHKRSATEVNPHSLLCDYIQPLPSDHS